MKNLVVKKVISEGQLSIKPGTTQAELLDQACCALDSAESCEILGIVLFQATNGKCYTITVEAIIGEADKDFVKETIAENQKIPSSSLKIILDNWAKMAER